MKKIFTKNLFLYMLIGLIVAVAAIFLVQTWMTTNTNTNSSHEKLATVKEKLKSNQEEVENITANLGESNLAKTRAFAHMIAIDPSIIDDKKQLAQIQEELIVNELYVIDENGIITHGTIDEYIGFDMGSGEQSASFLEIIDNPQLEIIQEPQPNAAGGTLMQYVGVARTDAKGLVQVGIRPEILEDMLAGTSIDVVLRQIEFGSTGYIFAVDLSSGLITAHKDASVIGKSAKEIGLDILKAGEGKATFNGETGYYVTEEYNDILLGTFMPSAEYYHQRWSQTLMVSISIVVILTLLLIAINRMVDQKIVKGINRIAASMKKIAMGDFSVVVNEKGNQEFEELSSNINIMVDSIRIKMNENEKLLKNNLDLINNIKGICSNLENTSNETLENAQAIYSGTGEQENELHDLEKIMNQLVSELNTNMDASAKISITTNETVENMKIGREQMQQLQDSIEKISNASMQIEKIISDINSIAKQTNILSINASIEAARAGEFGKGFAVVASQVGELAARCSQAALETEDLIMGTIQAVADGRQIAEQTTEQFDNMARGIEKASNGIKEVSEMVQENVSIVSQAMDGLEHISNVVNRNVTISRQSEQAAASMAEEAGRLLTLVE